MLESLLTPENLNSVVVVIVAMFAKDVVVGALRALAKKLLSDKNKKNDAIAEAAVVLADSLDKIKK